MRVFNNLLPAFLLGLTLFVPQVHAQESKVGTTSMQFLKVVPDARATAMAGAVSSIANTSGALFTNPAGIAGVSSVDVSLGYVDWFVDIGIWSGALAYRWPGVGTIGLHLVHSDLGDIAVTNVENLGYIDGEYNPGLTGESLSPSSTVAGLSFARYLTPKFRFGATGKYAREDLGLEEAGALLFDAGLTYATGFRSVALSIVVSHFGSDVTFVNEAFSTPQTFTAGISGYLMSPEESLFLQVPGQSLRVAFDVTHPRDYGQQYNTGVEYSFNDILFLRSGYRIKYDVQGLTFGGGLDVGGVRVDYSYADFGASLRPVHRFCVGLAL